MPVPCEFRNIHFPFLNYMCVGALRPTNALIPKPVSSVKFVTTNLIDMQKPHICGSCAL